MSESRKSPNYDGLVPWVAVVFVAWGLGGLLVNWVSAGDATARGTFGDMFGAVNALFSGCAFAGLIYTIRQQSEELSLQRTELQLTRNELSGQREQMKSQATTLKLQQFENTFFQLLRVHGEIVEAIDLVSGGGQVTKGRDCFNVFVKRLDKVLNERVTYEQRENPGIGVLRRAYRDFYTDHESEVGHYFRHLYHIIKFVDSMTEVEDKRRYTSFVRAQLSANELTLLFHNCLSPLGEKNFKPLIEKYGLLKHLPRRSFDAKHRLFAPGAYLPAKPSQKDLDDLGAVDAFAYKTDVPV
jgi:hypothetical protein